MLEHLAATNPTAYWAGFAIFALFSSVGAVQVLRFLVRWELRLRADARWHRDGRRIRRRVAANRVSAPHPLTKPAQLATPGSINGLSDYLDGQRARPFSEDAGPRDW
ncbi:hypothetical protein [Leifsonia shinshuensis]|uniref:Uncharacterized protein n=1 Tax=Leifsonia shinshuensis TaxID=150026 RepID=A0A853D0A2_9MICO|nr:hypothetical protein [Leifsonia shinshuensis]NYJ24460.1 hypothetical protein [Leifsonia shinshuensis]